jgi:hypothetical protein
MRTILRTRLIFNLVRLGYHLYGSVKRREIWILSASYTVPTSNGAQSQVTRPLAQRTFGNWSPVTTQFAHLWPACHSPNSAPEPSMWQNLGALRAPPAHLSSRVTGHTEPCAPLAGCHRARALRTVTRGYSKRCGTIYPTEFIAKVHARRCDENKKLLGKIKIAMHTQI